jgi:hypothetical protein
LNRITGLVVAISILLSACGNLHDPQHDCSAEQTKELLSSILSNEVSERVNDRSNKRGAEISLPKLDIRYELLRPDIFDESIKKYGCLGDVVVRVPENVTAPFVGGEVTRQNQLLVRSTSLKISRGAVSAPLKYSSQLLSDDQLYVQVEGYEELVSFLAAAAEGGGFDLRDKKLSASSVSPAIVNVKPSEISGYYDGQFDGGDGSMTITEDQGFFEVEVSVADLGCTGSVAGTARLRANVLTITAKEDDVECIVTATFGGGLVEVDENNCSYFHGAACGFVGKLKKRR